MVNIRSLEHVAVAYRDTDAAAQWYCDVLGFEIALKFKNPSSDANFYFIRDPAGTGLIEIIAMPEGDDTQLADISTMHVHLAFNVDAATTWFGKVSDTEDEGDPWPPDRKRREAGVSPRSGC